MKKNILNIIVYAIVDQVIKLIVVTTLGKAGKTVSIIPKIISLNYVENEGAAFGIGLSKILLIALDIVIVFIVFKILTSKKYDIFESGQKGLVLIAGGGIGNLIDRVFRGGVIDYIDISNWLDFPVFNFADILIVTGVVLLLITILINTIKTQESLYEKKH